MKEEQKEGILNGFLLICKLLKAKFIIVVCFFRTSYYSQKEKMLLNNAEKCVSIVI